MVWLWYGVTHRLPYCDSSCALMLAGTQRVHLIRKQSSMLLSGSETFAPTNDAACAVHPRERSANRSLQTAAGVYFSGHRGDLAISKMFPGIAVYFALGVTREHRWSAARFAFWPFLALFGSFSARGSVFGFARARRTRVFRAAPRVLSTELCAKVSYRATTLQADRVVTLRAGDPLKESVVLQMSPRSTWPRCGGIQPRDVDRALARRNRPASGGIKHVES